MDYCFILHFESNRIGFCLAPLGNTYILEKDLSTMPRFLRFNHVSFTLTEDYHDDDFCSIPLEGRFTEFQPYFGERLISAYKHSAFEFVCHMDLEQNRCNRCYFGGLIILAFFLPKIHSFSQNFITIYHIGSVHRLGKKFRSTPRSATAP